VQAAAAEHGQMGERPERPVADEEVTPFQRVMRRGRVGHVMRPQRRDDRLDREPGPGGELDEQMRRREAAPDGLLRVLSERRLQRRRVGHGKTGAINHEESSAVPVAVRPTGLGGLTVLGDGLLQPGEERDRQAGDRLAIRLRRNVEAAVMAERRHRRRMQRAEQREIGGDDRRGKALSAGDLQHSTQPADQNRWNGRRQIALDPVDRFADADHGDLLSVSEWLEHLPAWQEVPLFDNPNFSGPQKLTA
jgi:hypothetical protein